MNSLPPVEILPPNIAGAYAYLNRCLVHGSKYEVAPAVDEMVVVEVTRYMASLGPCDRRAAASMWWQYYVSFLLPALVTLRLLDRGAMPASISPRFGDTGLIRHFVVHGVEAQTRVDWFGDHLSCDLVPIVDTLQRFAGVARRALWANAASRLEGLFTHLAGLPAPYRGAALRGRAFLAAPLPDGSAASLGAMLHGGMPRVCCLRYRLAGFDLCGDCPRLTVTCRGMPATSDRSAV